MPKDKNPLSRELVQLVREYSPELGDLGQSLAVWVVRLLFGCVQTGSLFAVVGAFFYAIYDPADFIHTVKAAQAITPEQLSDLAVLALNVWVKLFVSAMFVLSGVATFIQGKMYVPYWPSRPFTNLPTLPSAVSNHKSEG